jgi:hypothetical protein
MDDSDLHESVIILLDFNRNFYIHTLYCAVRSFWSRFVLGLSFSFLRRAYGLWHRFPVREAVTAKPRSPFSTLGVCASDFGFSVLVAVFWLRILRGEDPSSC